MKTSLDKIILDPDDIDLSFSPLRKDISEETYILGAFNPGLERLPNGNLIIIVRIAEALRNPISENYYKIIRWKKNEGYKIDFIPLEDINMSDPRKFILKKYPNKTYCLTSSSWLLPVELNENGEEIIKIHYDKIIFPSENYQEYGIEDARITLVEDIYYMTVCSVSSTRHSTVLYSSENGIDYKLKGIIQDHQNKDMTLFPRKINSKYYALTRPTGDHYFASNTKTKYLTGPSIYMSESPDLLHWKPVEDFVIQPTKSSMFDFKVGAGAPPLETDEGWLVIFHGVEKKDNIGIYRSFICLLEKNDPSIITKILYDRPILESNPDLTHKYDSLKYLENVVFTSGIAENNDMYILASGELDLCCRLTHFNKNEIQKLFK